MDLTTFLGLFLGVGAVLASYIMEKGRIGALIQIPAMVLVIFGTLGAAIVSTSLGKLLTLPKLIMVIMFNRKMDPIQLIDLICDFSKRARKDGLLSLEKELSKISNKEPFLKKAIQIVIDGLEPNKIKEILEIEMSYIEERHKVGAAFFQKLGGFSPTLGIIGTVLGLIHALGNMESSEKMAESIASAFIATLWGVSMANLIYLPISDKLKAKHQDEVLYLEIITEGALALAMGDNPRVVRMKLLSFLIPKMRVGED
jgi:chemotaxis protein MotA